MQILSDLYSILIATFFVFAVIWLYVKMMVIGWRAIKGAIRGVLNDK